MPNQMHTVCICVSTARAQHELVRADGPRYRVDDIPKRGVVLFNFIFGRSNIYIYSKGTFLFRPTWQIDT